MAKTEVKDKAAVDKTADADIDSQLATGQALVEQKPQATGMAAYMSDMEALGAEGFEDVKTDDLSLPFFKLLQSSTPEAKRGNASYVKGAVEGLWFDTISQRMFKELVFVPCKFVTHYIEWDANQFGILIKNHATDRTAFEKTHRDEKTGKDLTEGEKTVIVPTAQWFGLVIGAKEINPEVVDDPGIYTEMSSRAVVGMSATSLKVSKRWISDAQALQLKNAKGQFFHPPLFAMSYLLGSVGTANDQGSWSIPTVKRGGWTLDYPNGKSLFDEAQQFSKFANEYHGQLIIQAQDDAPPAGMKTVNERDPAEGNNPQAPLDDHIPF